MPITTRVEPIDRDVRLIIDEMLSPAAQSKQFAAIASEFLSEADETNKSVLGRVPPNKTFVDGSEGARLESVRPDGVIVREYELIADLLIWIGHRLQELSPVGSGRDPHPGLYRKSHSVLADGVEIELGGKIPPASEYVFVSYVPYARKIEGDLSRVPQSRQAPDGVYEVTAKQARGRFGNVARIDFSYRTVIGGAIIGGRLGDRSENRSPAIVVSVR